MRTGFTWPPCAHPVAPRQVTPIRAGGGVPLADAANAAKQMIEAAASRSTARGS
jgi:hypothetical protein